MNRKLLILLGAAVAFSAGCSLIPEYRRPASPAPDQWPAGAAYGEASSATAPAAELPWREFFTDERLRQVVEMALNNNRDLRLAALNVERARALYGIQRAEVWPSVGAAASGVKQRVPADLSASGSAMTAEQYSVDLGITSWEIDFFGRIRSLKEGALEAYFATDQARRDAQILLVSAVANTWLARAADREILDLAVSTVEAQEAVYRLIGRQREVGLASELDLRRAQGQVDAARGDVALFTRVVAQDENALQFLVGSPVPAGLQPETLGDLSPTREIAPGLPSDVLLNRPDVLAAEHRLRAANANIGAARAAFFPRISLTGLLGTASAELSGLFDGGSGTWMFAPQIAMPIFDPRTWSAYDVTKVDREIAVTLYDKAIQTAFREVADALAVRGTVNRQIAAQRSLLEAVQESYRLARVRYDKGIDSYLGVLDAQRTLYGAQQGLIVLDLARSVNGVTLYKVLGGGSR